MIDYKRRLGVKSHINAWLINKPKAVLLIIALIGVGLVWIGDYLTGPYLSTSIFYLIPISFTAWWIDQKTGVAISLISALAWLITDTITSPIITNHVLIPYWNASVRLGFFLIVTFALCSLRQAKQRQEDMVAFMVHDLRAPLSNTLTSLGLLKEVLPLEDHSAHRLIEIGIASGQRVFIQIDALLDLARLEHGKLPLERKAVNILDLLEQAISQVSLMADFKQITFLVEGCPAETAVWADPHLSERVLVNLLSNAIKFSPENCPVTLHIAPDGQVVNFCIHNDGPGISPLWQKRIFQKFEQSPAQKAQASAGSGLGLAFCKLAIETQQGSIWLAAPNTNGTTICFTLPLAPENSST